MQWEATIAFWLVVIVCVSGPVVTWYRMGDVPRGWLAVWVGILAVAAAGRLLGSPETVLAALALWVVLVPVTVGLTNIGSRLAMQRRYDAARGILRLAALLHPADGFSESPTAITAMKLAHGGDLDGAAVLLERLRDSRSPLASTAFMMGCLLRQRWEELLAWAAEQPAAAAREPNRFVLTLRALGETGDVAGMIDRYELERNYIARFRPAMVRDSCRLMLFVFGGRPDVVDRILAEKFPDAPADQNRFWWASVRWAAGDVEAARREFEELLPAADSASAIAIRRRLSMIESAPAPVDDPHRAFLAAEASRLEQETRYTAPVTLFSSQAKATRALVAINLAVFVAEWFCGCITTPERLHDFGALCAGCVAAGQWWRIVTATFLHWNALHLAMNMLALGTLGPVAEAALGSRRFLAVYLIAAVGSMAAVFAAAWIQGKPCVCVGASGAVMGVIGATAAMMLQGWLRERAAVARGRGLQMVFCVVLQGAIDMLIPQLSFTAHLAGAAIGFTAALVLGDRLRR